MTTTWSLTTVTALAALSLTGCQLAAGDDDKLDADGSYVSAVDGALYELEVAGSDLTVTRETCDGIDPTETAFGSVGDGTAVTWDVAGAFGGEDEVKLELAKGGEIAKIAGQTFFAVESAQGEALREHHDAACSGDTAADDTAADDTATDPDETPPTSDQDEGDHPEGQASGEEIDLSVEEGQALYLRAEQAFSPQLERWVFDEDAKTLSFRRLNCLGQTTAEAVGALEADTTADGTAVWTATWGEDQNPHYPRNASTTTTVEVVEDWLRPRNQAQLVAHADVDAQRAEFVGMCRRLGENAAEFIF